MGQEGGKWAKCSVYRRNLIGAFYGMSEILSDAL
jgi:hypothetical protein